MEESGRLAKSGVKWSMALVLEIQQLGEDEGVAEAIATSFASG